MSGTELILPGSTPDESAVVERFVDASRELVPSVQVALAKRIVRPGSNRVVCLAARTSVPLSDDERASVSDLALRLSDGTNVVLSLSFYNDDDPPPPPARDAYERAYEEPVTVSYSRVDSETNLGLVVVVIALIAAGGFYASLTGPLGRLSEWKPLPKPVSAHSLVTPHKIIALHHPSPAAPRAVSAPAAQSAARLPPASQERRKPAASLRAKPAVRSTRKSGEPQSRGMFIPPPPPTFVPPPPPTACSLPEGLPPPVLDQLRALKPPAPAAMRSAVTSRSTVSKPAPKPDAAAGSAVRPAGTPDAAARPAIPYPVASTTLAPDPAPAYSPPMRGTAPVPGDDAGPPPLERIVLPPQKTSE